MAQNRRKASSSKSGSILYGVLAGLILGLGLATGVAYYVTKAPMPFVDKVTREKAQTQIPENVDPNGALHEAESSGSSAPNDTLANASHPGTPGSTNGKAATPSLNDEIGALLVTLGAPEPTDKKGAAAPASTPTPAPDHSAAPAPAAAPATPRSTTKATVPPAKPAETKAEDKKSAKLASTQTTYYLQAGAYRSAKDADAIRAQIILLGLPVQVQKVQAGGATLNRVRVGPFKGIDEMNRSRARLSEAKIDSSVVRP
ncbi:MAG: SPOR domain-containing protein [Burkholderiaceae bacterium]|nr:MAG: SPOR domain-containing protein [Burkholderiaceae bacterium]TAM04788.1 MAG: SPOR domain-containing protein [Pusillimonas sp.]